VFENKVVDYVAELATQTDKPMTREELAAIIQDEGDEVPEEHHH
jgi:trigger factor